MDVKRLFGIRSSKTDLNTPLLLWTQKKDKLLSCLEQIVLTNLGFVRNLRIIFIYYYINYFGNFLD